MPVSAQTSATSPSSVVTPYQRLKGTLMGSQMVPSTTTPSAPLTTSPVAAIPDTQDAVAQSQQPPQSQQQSIAEPALLPPEQPIVTAEVPANQLQTPEPSENQLQEPQEEVNSLAQSIPLAINEMTDTLNPPSPSGGTVKEAQQPAITLERPAVDQIPGVQYVEEEKGHEQAEMPPEVESYIQQVENHQQQIPQEIVIADQQAIHPSTKYLAKPVIVLPITPEIEKKGGTKSSTFSVRWLVEWSRKMMKVFSGKVVYKDASPS